MYLKYDYCPGFDSGNHYSAIVTKKNATLPPSMKPTPPPSSKPTLPSSMKHTTPSPTKPTPPPPNNQCEEPQEQTLENEEPLNSEHIQNQIEDLQKKNKKNPAKKGKGIESTCKIMKMLKLI